MIIGYFGAECSWRSGASFTTQRDRPYVKRLPEMLGAHQIKTRFNTTATPITLSQFSSFVRNGNLDCAIVTDPFLLRPLLDALPDFKISYNKKGQEKNLTLNDYHGSLIEIPGFALGRDRGLEVLFLNPLAHLYSVREAPFIYKRFLSKLTHKHKWFPQTEFTWTLAAPENIEKLYADFSTDSTLISVDIETDVDNPYRSINCSGYCGLFKDGTAHAVVIPTTTEWGHYWMRKFNDLPQPKIFQNGLYDNLYFLRWNAPVRNWLCDTQHLFHSWYSELPKRLDYITVFALRKVRFWKDDGKSGGALAHYEYNARDCWATLNSWLSLLNEVPDWAIRNYLQEFPLVFPCLHTEADGITVDMEQFELSLADVQGRLAPVEKQLQTWVHPDFNPGSSQQCVRLLKALGVTNGGKPIESADDKTLNAAMAISPFHEHVLGAIQKVREYRKLLSTYLVKEKFWNDRLYYKTNPAGTDSGRLACTESSFWCGIQIQNQPRGPEVKRYLRADDGWLLGENDFPQSEARCVGYQSGCTSLIDLVEGPHDYHSWNAQSFFGVPYESIYDEANKRTLNKKLRDLSKRTNHGANYNMGPDVMLDTMGPKAVREARSLLGLPQTMPLRMVCAHLLQQYARTYPEVKVDLQEWVIRTIQLTHRLVSPLGWTRWFFGSPKDNKQDLNAAIAHGPQNLSVGIINRGFYRVWWESVYGELRGKLRLKAQIHDSLLYAYKGEDTPQRVAEMMTIPVEVTDIKGVTRTLVIRPDVSCGKAYWNQLK